MYCPKCGSQISFELQHCPVCNQLIQKNGKKSIKNDYSGYEDEIPKERGNGLATASLILGLIGLVLWVSPIFGLSVAVIGFILGIISLREKKRKKATAGVVLSSICFVLSIACIVITIKFSDVLTNNIYAKMLDSIKNQNNDYVYSTEIEDDVTPLSDGTADTFSFKDAQGNELLTGGVKSALAKVDDSTGTTQYIVNIYFTKDYTQDLNDIIKDHQGETVSWYYDDTMVASAVVDKNTYVRGLQFPCGTYEEAKLVAAKILACER